MVTFVGVVLIILGICALIAPVAVGLASIVIIGILMVAAGIIECIRAFKVKSVASSISWLLVGILTLICGLLVIAHPLFGLGFLTLLLAIYFVIKGILNIIASLRHIAAKGWFIISGILSLLLGYLIWQGWPLSGAWAIGILLGIDFIFTGVLMLALKERLP